MKVTLTIDEKSYSAETHNVFFCVEALLKEAGELDENDSLSVLNDEETEILNLSS